MILISPQGPDQADIRVHPTPDRMAAAARRSLVLLRYKGIALRIHWSFYLLVGWVLFSTIAQGLTAAQVLQQLLYVIAIFCCVVLHEYGHALMAIRYGIRTRDITLLPVGGVARLERIPEAPREELFIALAGPMVNLVIAGLVLLCTLVLGTSTPLVVLAHDTGPGPFVRFVFIANLALFLFNLIPAFPMDGGRVLRALLAWRMDRVRATRIASITGRIFAVIFAVIGLLQQQPFLFLIGLFVFAGASAELDMVKARSALTGSLVRDVMRTRFWSLPYQATVREAADGLLAGGDHVLVVTDDGRSPKIVARAAIIAAMKEGDPTRPVGELEGQEPRPLTPDQAARSAYDQLLGGPSVWIPVLENGRVVGVVEPDNLAEYQELRSAGPGAA